MYVDSSSVPSSTLYQGDVVNDFPFYLFDSGLPIKKNEAGHFEMDSSSREEDRALFAIETKKQMVMILSQSCDIQRRTNVIVCPVYNLQEFVTDNTINADRAKSLKERKIYYWFYLPAYNQLPEALADLQTMIYVPKTTIEKYLPKRIATLNDLGRHHLAWSLATYFGRPADD